jgi:hypothetical protein
MLLERINNLQKKLVQKEGLLHEIKEIKKGVILSLGAGDIDAMVPQIQEILKKRVEI